MPRWPRTREEVIEEQGTAGRSPAGAVEIRRASADRRRLRVLSARRERSGGTQGMRDGRRRPSGGTARSCAAMRARRTRRPARATRGRAPRGRGSRLTPLPDVLLVDATGRNPSAPRRPRPFTPSGRCSTSRPSASPTVRSSPRATGRPTRAAREARSSSAVRSSATGCGRGRARDHRGTPPGASTPRRLRMSSSPRTGS